MSQQTILTLSDTAEISLLTCSPGGEVYSLFGHSALRVNDPKLDIDVVFNYGVFSYGKDFTYNFVMGNLNYKLGLEPFDNGRYSFVEAYREEGRGVIEQILNLDSAQKQEVFAFLNVNARPENREYLYDFFYDNCSSRIRDVLEDNTKAEIVFKDLTRADKPAFRDFIDEYGVYGPWIHFGIDLGLGLPCDISPSSYEYMFLPDFLFEAFESATINGKPLVKETIVLSEIPPREVPLNLTDPTPLSWILLGIVAILFGVEWRKKTLFKAVDVVMLLVFGAVGALIAFLWFVTHHTGTMNNLNILWAWPTHILALSIIWFKKPRQLYFKAYGIFLAVTLLSFPFIPQGLHMATIPLMLIGILRSVSNLRFG